MILPIKIYPDPILFKKSKEIQKITPEVVNFCNDLKVTLEADKIRVGLSANQVGKLWRIIAVKANEQTNIYINPKIVNESKDFFDFEEGCLSFPDIYGTVSRNKKVKVQALNLKGKKIKLNATGLEAVIFQHEIDHLNGEVFIDKAKKETLHKIKPNPDMLDIVFLGNSDFSIPILESLYQNRKIRIGLIITGRKHKIGRGQKMESSIIKKIADKLRIPVIETNNINNLKSKKFLQLFSPDYYVTASFGQLLKPWLLYKNKRKIALNVHPSLLPKYRGATPIQSALLNNDKITGTTIMLMTKGLDEGPVLKQEIIKIHKTDDYFSLSQKAAQFSSKIICQTLINYNEDRIIPKKQNNKKATFCQKISKLDGMINWQKPSQEIANQIKAYKKWPGSYTFWNKKRINILDAKAINKNQENSVKNNKENIPGLVVNNNQKIFVICKKGKLKLKKLQIEGKKPQNIKNFISGYQNFIGSKLF